jgi:hypothetical protein
MAAYDPIRWYDEKADNPPWVKAVVKKAANGPPFFALRM